MENEFKNTPQFFESHKKVIEPINIFFFFQVNNIKIAHVGEGHNMYYISTGN